MAVKMDGIRAIMSPVLVISYVFGIRIVEYPAGKPRLWCSFLYMLFLRSIYYFFIWDIFYTATDSDSESLYIFQICILLEDSIALLSVFLGIYHDKKYRACLRQLDIVDDTLEKIGMTTDYQKLYTKMLLTIFGWFAYIIWTICGISVWCIDCTILNLIYITFLIEYPAFVNLLDDLLITSTLEYIELKFEQINEYLRKLDKDYGHEIKRDWEQSVLIPCQNWCPKYANNEYVTWIAMHLHLELCKISRELNSIFGLQMTIKMAVYFAFIAAGFRNIFYMLLIVEYYHEKTLFIILIAFYLALNILRLFIINYMCEKISVKASVTGDIINRISYSAFNVVIRENISQFLLQINLTPLEFYGLGLFKFGLKFFYGFSSSVTTVIVILIQAYMQR